MAGRKARVTRRMPVLREHHAVAVRNQLVHQWYDLVATRNGQCAAGTKIVLDVDDDERFPGHDHSARLRRKRSDGMGQGVKPRVFEQSTSRLSRGPSLNAMKRSDTRLITLPSGSTTSHSPNTV